MYAGHSPLPQPIPAKDYDTASGILRTNSGLDDDSNSSSGTSSRCHTPDNQLTAHDIQQLQYPDDSCTVSVGLADINSRLTIHKAKSIDNLTCPEIYDSGVEKDTILDPTTCILTSNNSNTNNSNNNNNNQQSSRKSSTRSSPQPIGYPPLPPSFHRTPTDGFIDDELDDITSMYYDTLGSKCTAYGGDLTNAKVGEMNSFMVMYNIRNSMR